MPYAPGVQDISGQLLAKGITDAASHFAESQKEMRLTQKEVDHLSGTVGFAAQQGYITPEDVQEFQSGNLSKKREIATKASMTYEDAMKTRGFALTAAELAGIQGRHGDQIRLREEELKRLGIRDEKEMRLREEEVKRLGVRDSSELKLKQEEVEAMKAYRESQASTAAVAAAAKAKAEANKNKLVVQPGPKAGEIGLVNGQVVRPPTPAAEAKPAPDWAKETMRNDPTLFWNGTRLQFKQAYPGMEPGGGGAPPTSPAAPAPAPASPALSGADQQAMQWAQANPRDPRAAAILRRLGGR